MAESVLVKFGDAPNTSGPESKKTAQLVDADLKSTYAGATLSTGSETIDKHNAVLEHQRSVLWGLWGNRPIDSSLRSQLQRIKKDIANTASSTQYIIFFINPYLRVPRLYQASLHDIHIDGLQPAPNPELCPQYYRIKLCPAWFLISRIEPVPENIAYLTEFSYFTDDLTNPLAQLNPQDVEFFKRGSLWIITPATPDRKITVLEQELQQARMEVQKIQNDASQVRQARERAEQELEKIQTTLEEYKQNQNKQVQQNIEVINRELRSAKAERDTAVSDASYVRQKLYKAEQVIGVGKALLGSVVIIGVAEWIIYFGSPWFSCLRVPTFASIAVQLTFATFVVLACLAICVNIAQSTRIAVFVVGAITILGTFYQVFSQACAH